MIVDREISSDYFTPTANPTGLRILMCAPEFFGVEYEINPWMSGNVARSSADVARIQWQALHTALAARANIELVAPRTGVPDLVFTANAGLVLGETAILSHFRHPQRQAEEPFFHEWFAANGFDVIEMPRGVYFEGAGDALFLRDGSGRLVLGHGWRTRPDAATFVADALGVDVVPVGLVDDRFYHLDTCFCPLADGHLIWYPPAFDAASVRAIESMVPASKRHAVSDADAAAFACNAVDAGGAVVLNDATLELETVLARWGFATVRTPLTEFLLAGGSAKCLTLRLNE